MDAADEWWSNAQEMTAEMGAIDVFNDRLVADGHLVFAGGLGSPAQKLYAWPTGREFPRTTIGMSATMRLR